MQNYNSKFKIIHYMIIFWIFIAIFVPYYVVKADLIIPITPEYEQYTAVQNKTIFVSSFIIDLIFNGVLLIVLYSIFARRLIIKTKKFLVYIFTVTVGGFLIDIPFAIFWSGFQHRKGAPLSYVESIEIIFIPVAIVFILLLLYNYFLSRKFFKLTKKQCLIIALCIGILTHPLLGMFLVDDLENLYEHIFPFTGEKVLPLELIR